jgi:hypothetical protein
MFTTFCRTASIVCIVLQVRWCTATTSPTPTLFQCTQSTVCILQIRWCTATTSPTLTPFPEFPMGVQRLVSPVSTVLAGTSKSVLYRSIYFKFLKDIDWIIKTNPHSLYHGGRWSNRTYVALALFSLLSTCVVF